MRPSWQNCAKLRFLRENPAAHKKMNVAIVGASGAVGRTLVELFERYANEDVTLRLYGSSRSAGSTLPYKGANLSIAEFHDESSLAGAKIVFLCVSAGFSQKYALGLTEQGAIVIDNSSAFRYTAKIPLLLPKVNSSDYAGQVLLANPNCSSAIALMTLAVLERHIGLEHVQIASYQSASGAGASAIAELQQKLAAFTGYGVDDQSQFFHHNLAYNVIPHIDRFEKNGYTKEEMKAVWELRKILGRPKLPIAATCVRVPTLRSHGLSISVKLKRKSELAEVRSLWQGQDGLKIVDSPGDLRYPMPLSSSFCHDVEVGRLRHSLIHGKKGLDFFVCGDQLLRGAALNAYEIFCLAQG